MKIQRKAFKPINLHKGFTLVEMAIVLAIIGLITAGILVGQTLIRQSQVNSAMMDAQRYIGAANTFQQKYNAWPGDFATATTYWGAMTTCPPNPGSVSPGGTATCNGDGNNQVGVFSALVGTEGVSDTTINESEQYYFWQHLSNALLLQGTYSGIPDTNYLPKAGINVPAGRLPGLFFAITYAGYESGNVSFFDGTYNHILEIGGRVETGSYMGAMNPVFTALEAQTFDQKYDDGAPGTGIVRTWKGGNAYYSGNCSTTSSPTTSLYNVTPTVSTPSGSTLCSLMIITGF